VGIDPGITGATMVVKPGGLVEAHDTPFLTTEVRKELLDPKTGKRASKDVVRRVFDRVQMRDLLERLRNEAAAAGAPIYVTLEEVNGMPARGPGGVKIKIGATSAFGFGFGYGLWVMALCCLRIRHRLVRPGVWKRQLLPKGEKGDAVEMRAAARLYPSAADLLRGPRGGIVTGRVDGLLLAHYGVVLAPPELTG
jgi:hypothetical protein